MMTSLSGRGLFAAGATLLLAIGGIALAGTVGASSGPADPGLGPPVVVRVGTTTPAPGTSGPTPSEHHAEDDEHSSGPAVVGPAPAHKVDDEDDDRTAATHR
jgi:hypothetical protein